MIGMIMKKYLWIGPGIGPRYKKRISDMGGKFLSGIVSSDNLIDGLDKNDIDMDSINSCQLSEVCHVRRKNIPYIKAEKWSRTGMSHDCSVGYCNIKYVNILIREHKLKRCAMSWSRCHRSEQVAIIVYSMHYPFMIAAYEAKRMCTNAKIYVIVPDLPQYMQLTKSTIKRMLKSLDWLRIKNIIQKFDGFILYSGAMQEFLDIPAEKCMVMEGSYNATYIPNIIPDDKNTISVMYSGVLDLEYGIRELLDAMEYLPSNYELWLTGLGDGVEEIKKRCRTDHRIKYLGYFNTREELFDKQAAATMLISPRKIENIASRFCFPSKLFEYMITGKPVISCYLDGIPEDYYPYLICLEAVTPVCIANTIDKVAHMSVEDRVEMGQNARNFVLNNKTHEIQAARILDFIEKGRDR